jgi:hypothetical protein
MAQTVLGIAGMSLAQKRVLANTIMGRMTDNPNFPTPNPPLTALDDLINEAGAALDQIESLRSQVEEAVVNSAALDKSLTDVLTQLAGYVQTTSGGDPVKIESSGMTVRQPAQPVGPMPVVINVRATPGPGDGQVTLRWKAVKGRLAYEVSKADEAGTATAPETYTFVESTGKTRLVISGLTGCARHWFRVRALGADGPGPWSAPATAVPS